MDSSERKICHMLCIYALLVTVRRKEHKQVRQTIIKVMYLIFLCLLTAVVK